MNSTFKAYLPELFKHEGGFVDHPKDPGGATNLGITIATLRNWRKMPVTKQDVKDLTKIEASEIYRVMYWNKTGPRGADAIAAGPDAMLFDVAVNSGVGRAVQWYPLIIGKSAIDAVKIIGVRRRAFFQSLKTFRVFGRGWMRRVNAVEAWSLAWAMKAQGQSPGPILKNEAAQSRSTSKASQGGAAGATGGAVAPAASGMDWTVMLAVGLPMLVIVVFLVYQAVVQRSRADEMEKAFANV